MEHPMSPPRSIFRSRRRALVVTDQPEAGYHRKVVEAWRQQLRPGTLREAIVWHDSDCPRPRGGRCTCRKPDVEIVDAERN